MNEAAPQIGSCSHKLLQVNILILSPPIHNKSVLLPAAAIKWDILTNWSQPICCQLDTCMLSTTSVLNPGAVTRLRKAGVNQASCLKSVSVVILALDSAVHCDD